MHCNEPTDSGHPLVSVIVLTYCQESTIARTLDSVLAQRVSFRYEIVVGEDASTDGTRAVCEEYARRNPGVVRLMPKAANKGTVRNYFDTLAECRGDLIADCAGDDFWCDEHKLQRQVDAMAGHPEASVVHTGWYRYNEATGAREYAERPPMPADTVRAIALQTVFPVIHLCTALYRKRVVLDAIDSDPALFLSPRLRCEDLQVAYVLAKAGQVVYQPEPTLCYSVGHESVSNEGDELKLYEFFLAATDLSHEIVKREAMTGSDVDAYFQSRTFALLMHLLRADRADRLAELQKHIAQWQQPMSPRCRALAFSLAHPPLRHSLLALRRALLALRHVQTVSRRVFPKH